MSYLSQPTSNTDYGVVKVGNNISVNAGVIYLSQDLSPNASVIFANVAANAVYSNGQLVVTQVIPHANAGIALSNVYSNGATAEFTIRNTGVLSINAGPGIYISNTTGDITIAANGAIFMNTIGTNTSYTATVTDEYIGVYSANAVTITLPAGIPGRVYYIKDEYGQGSGKITIQPQTGEKIDSATNYIISVPFQSVGCVFRAGNWHII